MLRDPNPSSINQVRRREASPQPGFRCMWRVCNTRTKEVMLARGALSVDKRRQRGKRKKRNESGVKSSARVKGKRKGSKAEHLINQLRNSKSSLRMALGPDRDVQTGELARCMQ